MYFNAAADIRYKTVCKGVLYMYKDNGNRVYTFDGDLEQFLLDKGVEAEHIQRMKKKKLQRDKERYYDSEYIKSGKWEREKRLVPLSRVIGTSRGTVGESVFDNVKTMEDGEREPSRFYSCLNFLNKMSLEELRESYKDVFPVEMEYYTEEDEYYLTSDGNHRTLTAMLVGAEYINANVTPMYCDFEKRDKCLAVDKFYEEFNIAQINYSYMGAEIVFEDDEGYCSVNGFSRRTDENCYEYISNLSEEIRADMKLVKVWLKLPKIIVIILNMLSNNKRIIQYIEKPRYTHWKTSIHIYDFD